VFTLRDRCVPRCSDLESTTALHAGTPSQGVGQVRRSCAILLFLPESCKNRLVFDVCDESGSDAPGCWVRHGYTTPSLRVSGILRALLQGTGKIFSSICTRS
jgi:hypothetical protein